MTRATTWKRPVGAIAAAMLLAALPLVAAPAASADSGLAPGTYTVTANVYVDAADTPLGQKAFVTNPGTPPLNPPTSPATANATLVVQSDGTELLTVPIVNQTFGVLSIAPASDAASSVEVESTVLSSWTTWGGTKQRVSSITFDVTDFGGGANIATFSPSVEYANFLPYLGTKNWDLHLVVDFASAS